MPKQTDPAKTQGNWLSDQPITARARSGLDMSMAKHLVIRSALLVGGTHVDKGLCAQLKRWL